jgi:hypothetical protein
MVYLALEPSSALEAIGLARQTGAAVWVGEDAITHDEHWRLGAEGLNITRFAYPLHDASACVVADSIATIAQHHPRETIWVQHVERT